jgi:hypothetical protein
VGLRSTIVRPSVIAERYSRLRATVPTASAMVAATSITAPATRAVRPARDSPSCRDDRRHGSAAAAATTSATIALSGRFIRRAAPTSVTMGMRLDVGASVSRAQAPAKPARGHRTRAIAVSTTSAPMSAACPATSASANGSGHP